MGCDREDKYEKLTRFTKSRINAAIIPFSFRDKIGIQSILSVESRLERDDLKDSTDVGSFSSKMHNASRITALFYIWNNDISLVHGYTRKHGYIRKKDTQSGIGRKWTAAKAGKQSGKKGLALTTTKCHQF